MDGYPGPYKVSAETGRPGVSILWLGEVESLVCNFYLRVASVKIERYTCMLLGSYATNQQTNSLSLRKIFCIEKKIGLLLNAWCKTAPSSVYSFPSNLMLVSYFKRALEKSLVTAWRLWSSESLEPVLLMLIFCITDFTAACLLNLYIVFGFLFSFSCLYCSSPRNYIHCPIGADRFVEDIELMVGYKPPLFVNILWCIVTPVILLVKSYIEAHIIHYTVIIYLSGGVFSCDKISCCGPMSSLIVTPVILLVKSYIEAQIVDYTVIIYLSGGVFLVIKSHAMVQYRVL